MKNNTEPPKIRQIMANWTKFKITFTIQVMPLSKVWYHCNIPYLHIYLQLSSICIFYKTDEESKPSASCPYNLLKRHNREYFDLQPLSLVQYGSCTAADKKSIQRTVRTVEKIIKTSLLSIQELQLHAATKIISDSTHPTNWMFNLLSSGKHYRSMQCKTARLSKSSFLQAIRILISHSLYTDEQVAGLQIHTVCTDWLNHICYFSLLQLVSNTSDVTLNHTLTL